ncbi:hypothetical protein QWY99_01140 [Flavobacterium branchiarum]|uniref:Uncharacterized protein n=1 Tax=Flavobacterium branchiarum TaxID=1114870 RepID=A0ABV5FR00_9FLAO|nr:hypothetical protein [Flavobacterium branchiarum]MDN3671670.1 hypothetical protein [Flavobacterium branchiarum]
MKIELKLTADEINYLERQTLLVQSIDTNQLPKDKKAAYTIMLDVSDKLMTKAKQLNRKTDLFDQKKKHKITLKWHEAETLEQYIDVFSSYQDDPYKANLARKVIIQLNQKLA